MYMGLHLHGTKTDINLCRITKVPMIIAQDSVITDILKPQITSRATCVVWEYCSQTAQWGRQVKFLSKKSSRQIKLGRLRAGREVFELQIPFKETASLKDNKVCYSVNVIELVLRERQRQYQNVFIHASYQQSMDQNILKSLLSLSSWIDFTD